MTKQRINWEEVRVKLRASETALEESLAENPARIQAVFRKRAAHLARSSTQIIPETPAIAALVFTLRSERYALRLQELAEVLPFRSCTPVPGSAREFLGLISRHGELRSVMDLSRIILPDSESAATGFILMLQKTGHQIGLRVDNVEGLGEIPADRLDSVRHGKYTTKCTTTTSGETLLLLDSERLVADYL